MAGSNYPSTTKEKIESLRKEINDHNIRYYVKDAPLISDHEYDILLKKLCLHQTVHSFVMYHHAVHHHLM